MVRWVGWTERWPYSKVNGCFLLQPWDGFWHGWASFSAGVRRGIQATGDWFHPSQLTAWLSPFSKGLGEIQTELFLLNVTFSKTHTTGLEHRGMGVTLTLLLQLPSITESAINLNAIVEPFWKVWGPEQCFLDKANIFVPAWKFTFLLASTTSASTADQSKCAKSSVA